MIRQRLISQDVFRRLLCRCLFLGILAVLLGVDLNGPPGGVGQVPPGIKALSPSVLTGDSVVTFEDVAKAAGLTATNVWGGKETQQYIVEVKGAGLGFVDYDNDGWLDIYLTNGIRFGESYSPESAPVSHLYRNNRDGTYTDVTAKAGVGKTGDSRGRNTELIPNTWW